MQHKQISENHVSVRDTGYQEVPSGRGAWCEWTPSVHWEWMSSTVSKSWRVCGCEYSVPCGTVCAVSCCHQHQVWNCAWPWIRTQVLQSWDPRSS